MNVLVAVNYQREIPPFMQTELKYAAEIFDAIYYITPSISNKKFFKDNLSNIKLIEVNRKKKPFAMIAASFGVLLSNEYLKAFQKARKKRVLSKGLSMYIYRHKYCEIFLSKTIYRIIKKHYNRDSVHIVSSWFNETAYITAKAKKRYPNIKAYSFAHAFEIDPDRNQHINHAFDDYKFKWLDKVFFISETMRKKYINFAAPSFKQLVEIKSSVTYLGCTKIYPNSPIAHDEYFDICTCSNIVDVKRLHLIVDAIKKWNLCKMRWTHLGDGPLRSDIEKRISTLQNPNVEVVLKGKLTNEEVHRYYSSHKVDLFLNVSEKEGLPISIMEAMSYGICVMATNVGGTCEIINSSCGYLLPSDISSEQLYEKIAEFRLLNDAQKISMRETAKKTWSECFDAEKNIKDFYTSFLA